jgi:hypothetical protein
LCKLFVPSNELLCVGFVAWFSLVLLFENSRACAYTPKAESDFVRYHLGPQLEEDHPDVKIFIFDHNKDHMVHWAKILLDQANPASKYISGTAYHWYAGGMVRHHMCRFLMGLFAVPGELIFCTFDILFSLGSFVGWGRRSPQHASNATDTGLLECFGSTHHLGQ